MDDLILSNAEFAYRLHVMKFMSISPIKIIIGFLPPVELPIKSSPSEYAHHMHDCTKKKYAQLHEDI